LVDLHDLLPGQVLGPAHDDPLVDGSDSTQGLDAVGGDIRCGDPSLLGYLMLTTGNRQPHDGGLRMARRHCVDGMALLRDRGHRSFEQLGALVLADFDTHVRHLADEHGHRPLSVLVRLQLPNRELPRCGGSPLCVKVWRTDADRDDDVYRGGRDTVGR